MNNLLRLTLTIAFIVITFVTFPSKTKTISQAVQPSKMPNISVNMTGYVNNAINSTSWSFAHYYRENDITIPLDNVKNGDWGITSLHFENIKPSCISATTNTQEDNMSYIFWADNGNERLDENEVDTVSFSKANNLMSDSHSYVTGWCLGEIMIDDSQQIGFSCFEKEMSSNKSLQNITLDITNKEALENSSTCQ